MKTLFFHALLVSLSLINPDLAWAGVCADGQQADGVKRVGGNGYCMAILTSSADKAKPTTPLIVVLHGDGGGKVTGQSYPELARNLANEFATMSVFMLRPGYSADFGKSDGPTAFRDDDYSSNNVDYLSYALGQLRDLNPDRKLVLVGHSGGAAMTALLAAKYPDIVDAAVLSGCPCDVRPWRQWRYESRGRSGYWPNSLSPMDFAELIDKNAIVIAVSGEKDTNTLPKFSENYIRALLENGVAKARLISVAGASHGGVRRSREFIQAIRSAVEGVQ